MQKRLFLAIATVALLYASGDKHSFTGMVTDNMCGNMHQDMNMGTDDACVKECVKVHGAQYSLLAGKELYILSDQQVPSRFVAKKVVVTGVLDRSTMTLQVRAIAAAR
ncbi:MAG TPA: hypothetical protein VGH38_27510 [Bryobacteraceae bacterium]|jgi:hypothetical protein